MIFVINSASQKNLADYLNCTSEEWRSKVQYFWSTVDLELGLVVIKIFRFKTIFFSNFFSFKLYLYCICLILRRIGGLQISC